MARAAKKRKKEADDEEFQFPEFDEVDYMKREIEGAKAAILAVALAVPTAILLWALTVAGIPVVAFFLGLGLTVSLPRIYRVLPYPKVNTEKFERKDWAGHGVTFFFSWLAFWVLLLNPPFADVTSPMIAGVSVNGVALAPGGVQNDVIYRVNSTLNATVYENVALDSVVFIVNGTTYTPDAAPGSKFTLELPLPAGSHTITITATDVSGLTASATYSFVLG